MKRFFVVLGTFLLATSVIAQHGGSGPTAGGSGGTWGEITGTVSDQTDLQTEVDTKMEEPAGNGIAVRTGDNTSINRTITSSDGSNTVSNGNGTAGNIDIVVDTAVFPRYSSGTGDVPATGAVGTFYAETDANSFYTYPSTDTEHWLLSAAAGTTIGDFFYVSAVDVLTAINGTDGNLITWSAEDVPALVVTGASGNVLVSGGAGVAPTFTDMPYTSLADGTDGNLITWGADGAPALVATGTATQVLTSNGADTAPTFQAAAGGSSTFDPTTATYYDEFQGGDVASSRAGTLSWTGAAASSGTLSAASASSVVGQPTVYMQASTATDDSGYHSFLGSNQNVWGTEVWDNGNWIMQAIVGTDADQITDTFMRFGATNAAGPGNPSAGIYITRDTDLSHTTWVFAVCDSATTGCGSAGDATNQDSEVSTITPVAATGYHFKIEMRQVGEGGNPTLYFSVNGETDVTFCSSGCNSTMANLPTGNMYPFFGMYTRTTSAREWYLDMFHLKITGLSRY